MKPNCVLVYHPKTKLTYDEYTVLANIVVKLYN